MRYEKKVLILSCVLAALLLAWGAGLVFSPDRVAARAESGRLVAGKASDVASISLRSASGQATELARSGPGWVLVDGAARFPAQGQRVQSFLDRLAAPTRLRVLARSKASWSGFQLEDSQAKRATLKDGSGRVLA